jgi:hypothetical protein
MDKEMRRAIMCGNALNLYGLPARREQPDATEPDAA